MKRVIQTTLVASIVGLAGCEAPVMENTQLGYRGTGMVEVNNPRLGDASLHAVPDPLAPAPAAGPKAGDIYENVEVLGDLSVAQFTRMMQAMTNWVSPEQGCNYCHAGQNYASDELYTKVVSRRMLQMTRHINTEWKDHVADTGVTCYTCHRGQNVPSNIWYTAPDTINGSGMLGARNGQNMPAQSVGLASLPADSFSRYLTGSPDEIRIQGGAALPNGQGTSIQHTEETYGLMMHMSTSLGQNCTFCHNSRAFGVWEQSTPQRVTAWHGLRMVHDLINDYLDPLQPVYPEMRLGPMGDAPKANCATCHQGISKPLNGESMLGDYPSLSGTQ